MMSIYDRLIDSLSGYAVPYEDHPQLSTRDFEYDHPCLLYTSDAADDSLRVDLGGRRIIKKFLEHSVLQS